jgi:hypothetical protein
MFKVCKLIFEAIVKKQEVDREYINFYLISELLAEHYELHHSK